MILYEILTSIGSLDDLKKDPIIYGSLYRDKLGCLILTGVKNLTVNSVHFSLRLNCIRAWR